jgi:hypothetical protein
MPLEVKELVVRVNVGSADAARARVIDEGRLAELKRDIVETCLAELRRSLVRRDER